MSDASRDEQQARESAQTATDEGKRCAERGDTALASGDHLAADEWYAEALKHLTDIPKEYEAVTGAVTLRKEIEAKRKRIASRVSALRKQGERNAAAARLSEPIRPATSLDEAWHAWDSCRRAVEANLKAPKTATFPRGYENYVRELGNGRYRVEAYVDAQNVFGALLRTEYFCTYSNAHGVEALQFNPR